MSAKFFGIKSGNIIFHYKYIGLNRIAFKVLHVGFYRQSRTFLIKSHKMSRFSFE